MRNTITLNADQQVLLKEYIAAIALEASIDEDGSFLGTGTDFINEFDNLDADCEININLRGHRYESRHQGEDDYCADEVSAVYEGSADFYESGSDTLICSLPISGDLDFID